VFALDFVERVIQESIDILLGEVFVGESKPCKTIFDRDRIKSTVEVDFRTAGYENANTEWRQWNAADSDFTILDCMLLP